jgi:HEAT repeats
MSMLRRLGLAALVLTCCPWSASQAGVYIRVGIGGPYCYRPYGYGFYRPYPLVVGVGIAPAVVVQPAPVVVQSGVVQPVYSASPPPPSVPPPSAPSPPPSAPSQAPAPLPAPTLTTAAAPPTSEVMPAVATAPAANDRQGEINNYLQQLRNGDEQVRADALVCLGRLKAQRAIGPLVKALNSDGSPKVREAAARGLGLIGAPSSLSALQYAAQSDNDRDVRHSASFAAEVIRGNLQRRNP